MQELIAEEAANRKDIEDVIEEERAKVDAKTPITQDVFISWRQKNRDDKKQARADTETERKRKGVMTGREIFAQAGFLPGSTDAHNRIMQSQPDTSIPLIPVLSTQYCCKPISGPFGDSISAAARPKRWGVSRQTKG